MHARDIAAVRNVDPKKLGKRGFAHAVPIYMVTFSIARILRALATRHVFEEVAPDVFRNNRVSACMCTGKPVKEILEKYGQINPSRPLMSHPLCRPDDRWDGTNGAAAFISVA